MNNLKLMILAGLIIFSIGCTSIKYRFIHIPLKIPTNCNFEKFTQSEKNYLKAQTGQSIGKKIYRNQKNCQIRQQRIEALVAEHNKAHKPTK